MQRICGDCLKRLAKDAQICPYCGSVRSAEMRVFSVTISGKKMLRSAFLAKAAEGLRIAPDSKTSFLGSENDIPLPLREQTIQKGFSRSTFFGQKLPCVLNFALSCLSNWGAWAIDSGRNSGIDDSLAFRRVFLLFLAAFFFILGVIMLVDLTVRKRCSLFMNSHGQVGYVRFTKEQAKEALEKVHGAVVRREGICFNPLYTKRLVIREFTSIDAPGIVTITTRGDFCRYLALEPVRELKEARKRIEDIQKEYENGTPFRLAITLKKTRALIGFIGLSRLRKEEGVAEIVYGIGADYQRNGYMHEALVSFVARLRGEMGFKKVCATRMEVNEASGAVLLKAGFQRDETLDSIMSIHGTLERIIGYTFKSGKEDK